MILIRPETVSLPKITNPFKDGSNPVIYDIESYPNYFLVCFYEESGIKCFTANELEELISYISDKKKILIGFNSNQYDDLILKAIVSGSVKTDEEINELSYEIIKERKPTDRVRRLIYKDRVWRSSVDLMNLEFRSDEGGRAGLKHLAISLKHPNIQDLPIPPDQSISKEQEGEVLVYCLNDLDVTVKLWNEPRLQEATQMRLELSRLHRLDCLTMTKPQIAENILKKEYCQRTGISKSNLRENRIDRESIKVSDCISKSFGFQTDALNAFLREWRTLELQKRENGRYEDRELKRVIKIGEKEYQVGAGGLHSQDEPGIFRSDKHSKIIDIDVVSYYPNLILNLEKTPEHLLTEWLSIVKSLLEKRLEYKKAGEKVKSNGLKIVINSIFGKTGDRYSFMYDPQLMYLVTMMGQLYLLALAEELDRDGFEILSANTDGLTVRVPRRLEKTFDETCRAWEYLQGFELEKTAYSLYVRNSVNDYFAVTEEGEIKRKGDTFGDPPLEGKHDALVIKKAVIDYFREGIQVEDTILNESDIYNFTYSHRTSRQFKSYLYNLETQKRISLQKHKRWVISKSPQVIINEGGKREGLIAVEGGQAKTQKGRIESKEGYGVTLADRITPELLEQVERDHYIKEAKRIIAKIEVYEQVEHLRGLGLYPIPKEAKKNPTGSRMSDIREDWDWKKKAGLGLYTGLEAKLIAIDIDKPESCKAWDLFEPTLTVWKGEGSPNDILRDRKRGTLLYRCESASLKTTAGDYLERNGFEVLYGGKSVQVYGYHPDKMQDYHYSGDLKEIPPQLLEFLLKTVPKPRASRKKHDLTKDLFEEPPERPLNAGEIKSRIDSPRVPQTAKDRQFIQVVRRVLPSWDYEVVESDHKLKLIGDCPHDPSHRNKFDISVTEELGLYVECWHTGCNDFRDLREKLRDAVDEIYHEEKEVALPLYEQGGLGTIGEAFQHESKQTLILAPTGSGKTYQSARFFVEMVRQGKFVIYVGSNLSDLNQFIQALREYTGVSDIKDFNCYNLKSGKRQKNTDPSVPEEERAPYRVPKWAKSIVTHKTYLSRKGISQVYYYLLDWIAKYNPIVIIDEIDLYCESLSRLIPMGKRYVERKPDGDQNPYYYGAEKCPGFIGNGNCGNCHFKKYEEYHSNRYGVPMYYNRPMLTEDEFSNGKEQEFPKMVSDTEKCLPEKNLIVKNLEQHQYLAENKTLRSYVKKGEVHNLRESIRDIVDSSYNPTLIEHKPVLNGEFVEPEELTKFDPKERSKLKKEKKLVYPSQICGVPTLSIKDMSVLEYLRRKAERVVLLSATVTPTNREFLNHVFPEMKDFKIHPKNENIKIDELLLVGFEGSLKLDDPELKPLLSHGKSLIFKPTSKKALEYYESFEGNFPITVFKDGRLELYENHTANQWKVLVTHSRGVYGRAINLSEFQNCIVDTTIYKPVIALELKQHTTEEIAQKLEEDRLSVVIQNAGRILRLSKEELEGKLSGDQSGSIKKVIVFTNCEQATFASLVSEFKRSASKAVKASYWEHDVEEMWKVIPEFYETGEVTREEMSILEKEQEKTQKKLEELERLKLAELSKKVIELKREGMCWRDIYNKLKLHRYKNLKDKLREVFDLN